MARFSVVQGCVLLICGLCAVVQASLAPLPGESDPADLNPPSHTGPVLRLSKEDFYHHVARRGIENQILNQHIHTVLQLTGQLLANHVHLMEQTKALLSNQDLAIRWKRAQIKALEDGMQSLSNTGSIPPESIRALIQKTALMMPFPHPEEAPTLPPSASPERNLALPPINTLTMDDLEQINTFLIANISSKRAELQTALEDCQKEKTNLLASLLGWKKKLNSTLADQFPDFRALHEQYQALIAQICPKP